jgi:hypothetical protein
MFQQHSSLHFDHKRLRAGGGDAKLWMLGEHRESRGLPPEIRSAECNSFGRHFCQIFTRHRHHHQSREAASIRMSFEFRFSAIAGSLLEIISTGLLETILVYHCFVKDDTYVCMEYRLKLIGNKTKKNTS